MNRLFFALTVASVLALPAAPVVAATITAEGVAMIEPVGLERARQIALQDAMHQAALQAGVSIQASSMVRADGVTLDNQRIRPTTRLGKITVLREWQADAYFHVQIEAHPTLPGEIAAPVARYRKKIIAAPFTMRASGQALDIDDLAFGLSQELLKRLENSNQFLIKSSQFRLPLDVTGPGQASTEVRNLAARYESQFVLSGDILDAGSAVQGGYAGFFQQPRRRFEIEFFIHDGLTGALIARHRLDQSVTGEVAVGRDKPFASGAFFATAYGQIVNRVIDQATRLILSDLDNVPFTAKVVRVRDGKVMIDAGGTSLLAAGDELTVYRQKKELPVSGFGNDSDYGVLETPVATLSIVQVQPLFSVGVLSANTPEATFETGDLVRFDGGGSR